MTVTGWSATTNGYEQTTNGLWVHKGKASVGPPGTAPVQAGDLNVNRGNGAGVVYFGGHSGKYLYYDGTNFHLVGGALDAALWPGSALGILWNKSFVAAGADAWSAAGTGGWQQITPLTTSPLQCRGVPMRVDVNLSIANSVAGQNMYLGLGYNGAPSLHCAYISPTIAGRWENVSLCWLPTGIPAGANTFHAFILNSGGTASLFSGGYHYIAVSEHRA